MSNISSASPTEPSATPDNTNILEQKSNAIISKHSELTAEFNKLDSATPKTTFDGWTNFVASIDTASSEIKAVIALLDAANLPQKSVTPENINKTFFDEYAELYNGIKEALMTGDDIKTTISYTTYDKDILTKEFLKKYLDANNSDNPINKFIMAIKTYSLNSNASRITGFNVGETSPEISPPLLKAVLTALKPEGISSLLSITGTSYDTLNNLIEAITLQLKTSESNLQNEIKQKFMPSQGGGGSSSSLSTSKKNRKSHKYYHPGIGKTRKHHRCNHNKNSFVH
jgi:hypothetical protein